MSQIPFVNRLGDAIDEAIAKPAPARRRRRRRFGGLATAIFLLGAGGVTIAEILDDPEKLAVNAVGCYDRASLDANTTVLSAEGRAPTEVCSEVLGTGNAPLVACSNRKAVLVFPGRAGTCERLGLEPLPEGYEPARDRVARLRADVTRLVRSADCIPPRELARRVQRLLDRSGWRGWRAVIDRSAGPCGVVTIPVGMYADRRELAINAGPPRSVDRVLSRRGVALVTDSGERCFTTSALRRHVRRRLAPARRPIRFVVEVGPLPGAEELLPPSRQRRFEQGCAVVDDVHPVFPRPGRIVIRAEIQVLAR